MNKVLNTTRALIDFAIALHILVINLLEKLADREMTAAMKRTDTAAAVRAAAQSSLTMAKANESEAYRLEIEAKRKRNAARVGFSAELARFRRGVTA